ncbi:hypothetical protein [Novosphingobium sp. MD-1]|uniref:hypothetical protein n=1 Tax=Novosphingobium sp. MD-1 TaxID=1630648 RepID=UPI00061BB699|nr:hypothetical protein [Novosphingobium sp. MD-1]GAO56804.1 hypothetical protein NMD1_03973 [Novosphingobium sp. MD-1]
MKIIALVRFADGAPVDWAGLAAATTGGGPPPRMLRVIESPVGSAYRPPSDPDPMSNSALYDAAAIWDDAAGVPDFTAVSGADCLHAWQVEPTERFRRARQGAEDEAITLLGRLMFHADLPDPAAKRCWAHHTALAEKVHVGASRYIQNWITRAITPDCPPVRGLPELRFPDRKALIEGFFDSDRGRDEVVHDTSHFVASGPRLFLAAPTLREWSGEA